MEYLEVAKQLAQDAGEIIRKNFSLEMKKEWKSDGSPVTATDFQINKLVIERINKFFPDHSVLGEEESAGDRINEYVWTCDPVDGTIPFSHGIPLPLFLLALVKNGEPIVGVAYDPIMDRLFSAEKGKGTYLNGKPTIVSDSDNISGKIVQVTQWPKAKYYISGLIEAFDRTGAITMSTCSGYPAALIACGEVIGELFLGATAYDLAPFKVIVEEAGGKVTDLFGNEQRYDREINGAIVSNGKVHDDILSIIKSVLEKQEN